MKTIHLFLLVAAFGVCPCFGQKFTERQNLIQVDLDKDGASEWWASINARQHHAGMLDEYYTVNTAIFYGLTANLLRTSAARVDFEQGQAISKSTSIYTDTQMFLLAYDWGVWDGEVGDYGGEFRYQASAIVGAKYTDPDTGDMLVGWFKFSRPSTEPGTAFTLESWAYNPIPNEPIRAGEPPDLPEPSFAWSAAGVTMSWPAKASMLRLETATSLNPPVQWQPVETGGATSVTLPQPAAGGAFFRLVAPEP